MADKVKASDHDSYNTFTLISFVIPLVGIILGIVYLTKDRPEDKKLGEHLVAFGVLSMILWGIIWQVFLSASVTNSVDQIQL